MRARLIGTAFLLALTVSVTPTAKQPRFGPPSLVTVAAGVVIQWRHNSATSAFDSIWESTQPASSGSHEPYIDDIDGDGTPELLVVDSSGMSIFGSAGNRRVAFPRTLMQPALVRIGTDAARRPQWLIRDGPTLSKATVGLWTLAPGGFREERVALDGWPESRAPFVFMLADPDNDGIQNLITAGDEIVVFRPRQNGGWAASFRLPFPGTLADVVRVADVDADGRSELVAVGNSGKVTVYRHRTMPDGRQNFPVVWQSELLRDDTIQIQPGKTRLLTLTQGLAVADLDAHPGSELLVGTVEPSGERGRIHVFTADDRGGFRLSWRSELTDGASIPAFVVADFDGDGLNEFVYNGRDVYGFEVASKSWRFRTALPLKGSQSQGAMPLTRARAVAGSLPALTR